MGQRYSEISDKLQQFIAEQKIFFVGTAAVNGRVNISPKGMDSLRVLGDNRVVWLNVTGSGNETSAHVQPKFCSGALLRPTNARNLREKIEKLSLTVRVSTPSQ